VNLVPQVGENGKTLGCYIVASDITELRETEEALRRRRKELAHVSRITTMGELAASIAHEVNQPLCAIVSNAETAQKLLDSETSDVGALRDILRDIVADGNRSTHVVARVRSLVRREEPRREPLEVNQMIRGVVPLLESDLAKREASIRLDLADDLPPVMADQIELQQVVLNLIINAAQAMHEVEDGPRTIVLRSSVTDEDMVTVAVRDTGVGLDEEQKDHIFDAFFSTKPGGMGMGLSINRTIIESLGGHLWATQNTGPGATFHFSLPTEQESEAQTNARTVNGFPDE
jgi:C4-dicarboxylate-specific signal transduction histidine kinase